MRKKGIAAFLRRKQYVIAGALVVLAAVGTTVLYSNNQEQQREQLEQELAAEQQAVELAEAADSEEAAEASSVIAPKSSEAEDTDMTEQAKAEEAAAADLEQLAESTEAEAANGTAENSDSEAAEGETAQTSTSVSLHFSPENGIEWPLEGNVILNYSMDSTVYFATLDQYKYNPAVIIQGEINDKVYSVAKGKVTSIENDEVTGCTMTVDLGDGYTAIYGQLKEANFVVGDYVEAGHVLGYVAEPTKYFSVEGSNLYFAMEKDGSPIDPMELLE